MPEMTNVVDEPVFTDSLPIICPADHNAKLETSAKCNVKYLDVCTTTEFHDILPTHCARDEIVAIYKDLAGKFSQLAVSGDGDRTCIYLTNQIACELLDFRGLDPLDWIIKFQQLSGEIWDMCGKDNALISMGSKLNQLTSKTVQCAKSQPPKIEEITLEPISTAQPTPAWTTMKDGRCSIKKYNRLAFIFEARAFDVVDRNRAVTNFKQLSNQVAIISRKWRGVGCSPDAFQVPCHYLEFPLNIHACGLAKIFERLYLHVESHCPEKWKRAQHFKYKDLMRTSMPKNGQCPTTPLSSEEIKRSDRQFAEQFGVEPSVMLKDITGNKKRDGKSERQKIFDQKALQKKEDKLIREQQKLARRRRQKIKVMVLEKLEEELVNATPADVDNILQRSDIRFDSVQGMEAPEEAENYELEELDYYEEPQICIFSDFSNHRATWHTEAIEKFDKLLTEAARENSSGSFSAKFALKIRTRYDALLKEMVILYKE